jgi:hypothetical protein
VYTRKLLHQYIVDAFVKIEANRINWIKTHQKELHVEQYKGSMDYVKNNTGVEAISRVTIMPSTFQVLTINFFKIYFKFYIKGKSKMYGSKLHRCHVNCWLIWQARLIFNSNLQSALERNKCIFITWSKTTR